jgi:hypothetical protein
MGVLFIQVEPGKAEAKIGSLLINGGGFVADED